MEIIFFVLDREIMNERNFRLGYFLKFRCVRMEGREGLGGYEVFLFL